MKNPVPTMQVDGSPGSTSTRERRSARAATARLAREIGPGRRSAGLWRERWPTTVSVLLVIALVPTIAYGLLSDHAYRGYPHDVVVTSRAQDLLTLIVLPLLVAASRASRRGSLRAHILWLGLLFFVVYSYAMYLIGWEQNRCFLLYAIAVTLAVAALLDGLVRVDISAIQPAVRRLRTRGLGWFLIMIGVLFAGLWLTDVGPMVVGGRPPTHLGPGGTPYAVYVLDLVAALPVVIAAGVMLVRSHPISRILAGVVLVKIATLFTALWLGVVARQLSGEDVAFTPDMVPSAALLIVSLLVLYRASRQLKAPLPGWLHDQIWTSSGRSQGGRSESDVTNQATRSLR